MKYILLFPVTAITFFALGWIVKSYSTRPVDSRENIIVETVKEIARPLEKYTLENLSSNIPPEGVIEQTEMLQNEKDYTSYLFKHKFDPALSGNNLKTVTGQINIPVTDQPQNFPLVIMLRGFVNQEIYTTGMGTRNAAAFFAENGFATIAPDFLGYGSSDKEADNIFETRFQTYTTVLSLIKSLPSLNFWDGKNVFIWAHSNGGQVALTTLSASGVDYPTTLWAPVTKPFPYSILYYSIEASDRGKFIRRELAKFEELYDVEKYSFDNYLDRINASIQLHQGTADDAIPLEWSSDIVRDLKANEVDITYFTYPGADHDLRTVWDSVVAKDLEYFTKQLK